MMNMIQQGNAQLVEHGTLSPLEALGLAANQIVSQNAFNLYRQEKAANTITTQKRAVAVWCEFLSEKFGVSGGDMWGDPSAWKGVTFGLVESFKVWSLNKGHAIGTVMTWVKAIRKYCELASQAGYIDSGELARIKTVKISGKRKARQNVDKKRDIRRVGRKKEDANTLSDAQVCTLLDSIDTTSETGKRDKLLACILFEHGLRMGEVLQLDRNSFFLGHMRFNRPKVGLVDCEHKLTAATKQALKEYQSIGHDGPFLQSSKRGGSLSGRPLSQSSLKRIVKAWGVSIGVPNLSPHDARHSLATKLSRDSYNASELMDFFGWGSLSTAQNYIKRNALGNKGVDSSWKR